MDDTGRLVFEDFSPSPNPSLEQQVDALRKGLGRVFFWARTGHLKPEALLNVALRDQRFDRMCEAPRGPWLWNLIKASGFRDELRQPILAAVRGLSDSSHAEQLFGLAFHFANEGDDEFADALIKIVSTRQVEDASRAGETELIRLKGLEGFGLVARLRGSELMTRDWTWDDHCAWETACEAIGAETVAEFAGSTSDQQIHRFHAAWLKKQEEKDAQKDGKSGQLHAKKTQRLSVDELLASATGSPRPGDLIGWGRDAAENDLLIVQERMFAESDPRILSNLLRVFSRRSLPSFDSRLLALTTHHDPGVARFAAMALEENQNSIVREFALSLCGTSHQHQIAGYLVLNFQSGDESLIESSLVVQDDDGSAGRHGMLLDTLRLLEKNSHADPSRLGMIVYFHTPCDICRSGAAELLINTNHAPPWMLDEIAFDSNPPDDE